MAWASYKEENLGLLVQSYTNADAWVLGNMRNPAEVGDTNLIMAGKLYPYARNTAVYHCPGDRGVPLGGQVVPSVRSYSMNCFMGGRDPNVGPVPLSSSGFTPFFTRDSDLPRTSDLWVLVEEDERSINDGFFITDPTAHIWFDFPANSAARHTYSFSLAFADGHADSWRYSDPRSFRSRPGNIRTPATWTWRAWPSHDHFPVGGLNGLNTWLRPRRGNARGASRRCP